MGAGSAGNGTAIRVGAGVDVGEGVGTGVEPTSDGGVGTLVGSASGAASPKTNPHALNVAIMARSPIRLASPGRPNTESFTGASSN